MLQILAPVVLIFVLSFWANRFLATLMPFNLYLVLLFPGVVIHELSHFALSVFTGTPVHGLQLFSATGGHIIHEKPRIPVIGQFIISFAPLVIGIALSVYLIGTLPLDFSSNWHLSFGSVALKLPRVIETWHWWHGVLTYLLLSIILTLTPSKQDISASAAGIFFFFVVLYVLQINGWLNIPVAVISVLWYINSCLALIILTAGLGRLIFGMKVKGGK
jgi:hypothetical protein